MLCMAVIFISPVSNAREWYIQPTTKLRIEVDDNLRLREEGQEEDVFGIRGSFFTKYGTRTETSNIDLTTLIDVYRYWGQENLDRENMDWKVGSNFQVTEQNKIGLDADYIRDTSITSEQDLTGLTQVQVEREKFNISPHWTYILSETQSIQSKLTHEEVTYDDTVSSQLTSYKTDSANLNYSHQWRADTQLFVSLSALQYRLTDIDVETDDYSINGGFDYNYSQTLSFNFMLGARFSENRSNINGIETDDSSIGSLFSLGLKKQFESSQFDLSYTRSVSPSGSGEFLQADRFKVNASHDVTERLTIRASGAINYSTSTNDEQDNGRTYYSFQPTLDWKFNRQSTISGGYRYRMQEFDNRDAKAVSNGFFVTINYQWDKISTNRF